ncbi:hypothetical protein FRX31_012297, partial [Thalictrum thalictroides]
MASFLLPPNLSLLPTDKFLTFQSQNRRITRRTFLTHKWKCSATEQPKHGFKRITTSSIDVDKGTNPVGFLNKHGITHKAFAQFLRE